MGLLLCRTRVLHAAETGQDQEALQAELAEACQLYGRWAELKGRAASMEPSLSGAKAQHLPALDAQAWASTSSSSDVSAELLEQCADEIALFEQVAEVTASSTALLERVHRAAASGLPSATALELLQQDAKALDIASESLMKTQKLFGLPVTLYPALMQVTAQPSAACICCLIAAQAGGH